MSDDLDLIVALGTPALVCCLAGYVLALTLGIPFQVLAIPMGPVAFYGIGRGLHELGAYGADPDEAFSESLDNIEVFVVTVVALIGWEVGVVGGAIHGAFRRRAE